MFDVSWLTVDGCGVMFDVGWLRVGCLCWLLIVVCWLLVDVCWLTFESQRFMVNGALCV